MTRSYFKKFRLVRHAFCRSLTTSLGWPACRPALELAVGGQRADFMHKILAPKASGITFCEQQERKFNRLGVLLFFFFLERFAGWSSVAISFYQNVALGTACLRCQMRLLLHAVPSPIPTTEHYVQSNLSLRPPDKRDHLKTQDTQFQSHVVHSALNQTWQVRPSENQDHFFPVSSVVVIHRFDCTVIHFYFGSVQF